ncbi:hypothetical protein AURDEDRAFT_170394 [Auricularia subglabra TFB-10046 SS5]|nr:hypothetical protein AURDEDRAFT_170394 [Auricularia subglabra TFB-10046 SS5]
MLRANGPDFFHIDIDGDQRWASEVDVHYLGRCAYRYPFRLASGSPFNLSIWWTFQNYRAALETEELATQYDVAKPVLDGTYQMIYPLASARCPPALALSSDPAWHSPAQVAQAASRPECSDWEPTEGVYLRAHHTELLGSTFQGYTFQPTGCRWTDPLRYGAPRIRGFKPRKILFLGDSHTRYAYDLLIYAYNGDWYNFTLAPAIKGLVKSERCGPVQLDFVWESVLLEDRIQLNCSVVSQYDTIVLGGGQHNGFKIPTEADHAKQWTLKDWSNLTANIARRLDPHACPGQQAPKVVWVGDPARITRRVPAPRNNWLDSASSWRVRLYDEIAWSHFRKISAARVDMFALSQPFVNHFVDTLHLRQTDSMPALIQDLHQKIQPFKPAYHHLERESSS